MSSSTSSVEAKNHTNHVSQTNIYVSQTSSKENEKQYGIEEFRGATHLTDGSLSAADLEVISVHLDDRTLDECLRILQNAIEEHKGDSQLDVGYYHYLIALSQGPLSGQTNEDWETAVKTEAFLIYDWSIYPAVRSVTRPIDEENFDHYENIRVYLSSIIWSCSGSVLATFFAIRYPGISLPSSAIQILIGYTGWFFQFIPDFSFPIGFGRRCHFGGGKWNYKEQNLATCGMSVGNVSPYCQSVIICMSNEQFFGFKDAQGSFSYIIMLTLSTNLMGFGLAGLYRVFLVYPTRLVWWGCLPSLRLSRIIVNPEPNETINGWSISGFWVFWISCVVNFCWYWIVGYVFPFFSLFDWMSWISPHNNNLISICGVNTGALAVNPFPTLDPTVAGYSTMVTPWFSTVNNSIGMLLAMFVIIGMWYMNVSYTSYFPINSNTLYNRFGKRFNVSAVLNDDNNLDKEKYLSYSMPFWSAGSLVSYGSFFAFYPAMIMYAILEYGAMLKYSFTSFYHVIRHPNTGLSRFDDRFTRSQRKYKEVPEWWYALFLCICIGLGIATVEHWKFSNTPVWTIFFAIGLSAIFMIPSGVLYATTNTEMLINVLYELVIGLTNEGNASALMISKAYATNFQQETESFVSNLKTGHYSGIAPRAMFRVQVVNAIANSFVQAGLMTWQSQPDSIPNMCSPENALTNKFTCMNQRIYFNAAVQWGTIGPRRVLRDLYPRMRYTFLFGALFPVPFYLLRHFVLAYARRHKWGAKKEGGSRFRNSSFVRSILGFEWVTSTNELVILTGCLSWAPNSWLYVITSVYIGYVFARFLPTHYPKWWSKYNYLLYTGGNVGLNYSALILFFALQYKTIPDFDWWGNDEAVSLSPKPRLKAPKEGFGPHYRW